MITLLLWLGAALSAIGVVIYARLGCYYCKQACDCMSSREGDWERYHKLEGRCIAATFLFAALCVGFIGAATL